MSDDAIDPESTPRLVERLVASSGVVRPESRIDVTGIRKNATASPIQNCCHAIVAKSTSGAMVERHQQVTAIPRKASDARSRIGSFAENFPRIGVVTIGMIPTGANAQPAQLAV